jgi:hypothetical protein
LLEARSLSAEKQRDAPLTAARIDGLPARVQRPEANPLDAGVAQAHQVVWVASVLEIK